MSILNKNSINTRVNSLIFSKNYTFVLGFPKYFFRDYNSTPSSTSYDTYNISGKDVFIAKTSKEKYAFEAIQTWEFNRVLNNTNMHILLRKKDTPYTGPNFSNKIYVNLLNKNKLIQRLYSSNIYELWTSLPKSENKVLDTSLLGKNYLLSKNYTNQEYYYRIDFGIPNTQKLTFNYIILKDIEDFYMGIEIT